MAKAAKAALRFDSARDSASNRLSRDYLTFSCRSFSRIRTECRWEYISNCLSSTLVGPPSRAGARKPGGKCRWNYMVERVRKHEVVGSYPTRPATGGSSAKNVSPTLLPSAFRASQPISVNAAGTTLNPKVPRLQNLGSVEQGAVEQKSSSGIVSAPFVTELLFHVTPP